MLHVTNGEAVVGTLRASGLAGDTLAWDDVLHAGPVRAGLGDPALRAERAHFLSLSGRATYGEALRKLEQRDRRLEEAVGHEEIVLWFEADLYDQLQILQILDRLDPDGVEMICVDDHPSTERFIGLGQLEPAELPPLFEQRRAVTPGQVEIARRGWAGLREPTPEALDRLRGDNLSALTFLADALTRLLEELPWTTDGLSRTERSLLAPLAQRRLSPPDLFHAHMAAEERPFLGDTYAGEHMKELSAGKRPLMTTEAGKRHAPTAWEGADLHLLELSEDGHAVLAGDLDAVELRGINRWVGGTHLLSTERVWRWDPGAGRAVTG